MFIRISCNVGEAFYDPPEKCWYTIQIEINSGEWNFYPEEWIGLSSVLEDYA